MRYSGVLVHIETAYLLRLHWFDIVPVIPRQYSLVISFTHKARLHLRVIIIGAVIAPFYWC